MFREHKKSIIASSVLILLPVLIGLLLLDRFDAVMITHWGADAHPDGSMTPLLFIVALPLLLLALHLVCLWVTSRDQMGKNQKMLWLIIWIMPVISNLCCCSVYAINLGYSLTPMILLPIMMGVMFAVIGNYMPKVRMNSTMGIKIYWTYTSQENWNATHRLAGKVWFICGIVTLLCAFLPMKLALGVMVAALAAAILIPTVYSWWFYRRQVANGEPLSTVNPVSGKYGKYAIAPIFVILAGVGLLMFTGNIACSFGPEHMTVEASYYADLSLRYDVIESVEYREENVEGYRVSGFGSPRLAIGFFQSQELGNHTRYTYTQTDATIIIRTATATLVINAESVEATRALLEQLQSHIPNASR